jgi:hypothetical protein
VLFDTSSREEKKVQRTWRTKKISRIAILYGMGLRLIHDGDDGGGGNTMVA